MLQIISLILVIPYIIIVSTILICLSNSKRFCEYIEKKNKSLQTDQSYCPPEFRCHPDIWFDIYLYSALSVFVVCLWFLTIPIIIIVTIMYYLYNFVAKYGGGLIDEIMTKYTIEKKEDKI